LQAKIDGEIMAPESKSLCKAIGLTSKLLGIYINDSLQLNDLNLTLSQFVVLKILRKQNGICQNELAFITERDKTSLTRLINTLETKGLVSRQVSNLDKRKRTIFITSLGIEVLDSALPLIDKLEEEIASNITPGEFDNLLCALNKIQANVLNLESVEGQKNTIK